MEARGGDGQALGSLLEAAHEDLRAAAAGVVRHRTRAYYPVDEVFADAMLSALRELGSLRATNYVGFRYWFASIARNHVRRLLRRARGRPETRCTELEAEEDRSLLELSAYGQDFMRDALERLPRSQQLAFVLRSGLALTWTTIGFVLDRRAAPAARLLHHRALGRVKDLAATRPDLRQFMPAIHS